MKNILFSLTMAIIYFLLSSFNLNLNNTDILNALSENKIKVEAVSLGGFSGKCVSVNITNLNKTPYNVLLKSGTLLNPNNPNEQTLIVNADHLISLKGSETKTLIVSAFCTEMNDKCPSNSTTFKLKQNTNSDLNELLKHLKTNGKFEDDLIQQAVWCVTDGNSISNIYDSNISGGNAKNLRTFLSKLTKQEDTWYTTRRNIELDEERRIVNTPTEVKGKLTMNNAKPLEVFGEVKDAAGNVKWAFKKRIPFPAGQMTFDFRITVSGWEKGEYSVNYISEDNILLHQKFTI
jgi:hypothetical protein